MVPLTTATAPPLGERFERALTYAAAVHAHDYRKGTSVPYVSHLLGVCALVLEFGGDETAAVAALLHDTAEDHGGFTRLADVREHFGDDVAAIVEACSDSLVDVTREAKAPWPVRKRAYLQQLKEHAHAPDAERTLLVSAADKLHNLRTILTDLRRAGPETFARFSGGVDGTLWYYRALCDVYAASGFAALRDIAAELDRTFAATAAAAGRDPKAGADELWRRFEAA